MLVKACLMMLMSAAGGVGADLPPIAFLSLGYHELWADEGDRVPNLVALTGDFTRDGRPDEVRILVNEARNDAVVVVVAHSGSKVDTYVVYQVAARRARSLSLRRVIVEGEAAVRIDERGEEGTTELFDGEEFRTVVGAALAPSL